MSIIGNIETIFNPNSAQYSHVSSGKTPGGVPYECDLAVECDWWGEDCAGEMAYYTRVGTNEVWSTVPFGELLKSGEWVDECDDDEEFRSSYFVRNEVPIAATRGEYERFEKVVKGADDSDLNLAVKLSTSPKITRSALEHGATKQSLVSAMCRAMRDNDEKMKQFYKQEHTEEWNNAQSFMCAV